ncbi:MAG TPA: DUF4328 domain-containing protein [Candidatus Limnocylindrales bacterium]|nr:DUF4328 domain-containing protein [Candidatus Limnocylindrales bacterium]
MTDVWVCSHCKSINRLRDSRCYSCGQRQEEVAAAAAGYTPNVRLAEAVANRTVRGYQSSAPFAVAAGFLIVGTAALGLWQLVEGLRDVSPLKTALADAIRTGSDAAINEVMNADNARLASLSSFWWLFLGLGVLAFGLWLSRVRLNIPALGGGTPTWGPWKAFLYPLIPIVNLVRVPGMINDAMYRLDPRAGGLAMVALAWIGFVGSRIVWIVGTVAITTAFAGSFVDATSLEDLVVASGRLVDQTVALAVITELMTATGAVLLVALIARIEMRAAARDEEIRAQLGPVGPVAPPSTQPSTDAPPPAPGAPVIAGAVAPMDTSSRGVPGVAAVALGADAMPAPAPTNPQPLRTADAAPSPEAGTRTPGSRPLTIPRPDLGGSPPTRADTGPVAPPPPPPPAR